MRGGVKGTNEVDLSLPHFKKFVALIAAVCIGFGLMPFIVALGRVYPSVDEATASFLREILNSYSAFGQMFGFLAALFSGAALVGVVYAIVLQRRQLLKQQEELELMTEELAKSATAQQESQRALDRQVQATVSASLLTATTALAEHYNTVYLADRQTAELDYQASMNDPRAPAIQHTILWKRDRYRRCLEWLFQKMVTQSGVAEMPDGNGPVEQAARPVKLQDVLEVLVEFRKSGGSNQMDESACTTWYMELKEFLELALRKRHADEIGPCWNDRRNADRRIQETSAVSECLSRIQRWIDTLKADDLHPELTADKLRKYRESKRGGDR